MYLRYISCIYGADNISAVQLMYVRFSSCMYGAFNVSAVHLMYLGCS